jgi:NAD(P)-dependent dehydrogenase (short-subunit alcohol dehydrogenase family)
MAQALLVTGCFRGLGRAIVEVGLAAGHTPIPPSRFDHQAIYLDF